MNRQTEIDETRATVITSDLLVSFPGKQFARAKREILRILARVGITDPWVTTTSVWGIAFVRTGVDTREVIARLWALWESDPLTAFRVPLKWLPVDHWCQTDLEAIREVIETKIVSRIREDETWALRVRRRRWERYSTEEIIAHLAENVRLKVDLSNPDWIIWVDVVGRQTAVRCYAHATSSRW